MASIIYRLVTAGCFSLVSMPVSGATVAYDFVAALTNVDPVLQAAGYTINSVDGSFAYNTDGTDTEASPNTGEYDDALLDITFSGPGGEFPSASASGFIGIENDNPRDVFRVGAVANALSGTAPAGFEIANVFIFLENNSQTALSSDALPLDLDFSLFVDERIFSVRYARTSDNEIFAANGELTNLLRRPPEVVPLPATLPLLTSALVLLAMRRRV